MIKYNVLLGLLMVTNVLLGQGYTLVSGSSYKYKVGSADISEAWRESDYDDSPWSDGRKSIGFGDDDDSTVVEQCISVFLRYRFTINSLDSVRDIVLNADYDDGFVAYINGREVARKFMGAEGAPVAYDQLAERSREAVSSQYHSNLYGYFIDTAVLRTSLRVGSNILAVQVHNDSISGSDLSFSCHLINRTRTQFNPYDPAWRAIKRVGLDSTLLPIVIITTKTERGNYGVRQPIALSIIHSGTSYNKPTDSANEYCESATYEIRGQSSSDWAKKSYNIELKDLLGSTQDKSILGMSKHNDWVLAATYTDRSLIRNMLTYSLARQSNTTAPDSRFVELIMDGDYMGVYQFIEKPRRDKQRINVEKQDPFQTENISGGYIFKFDKNTNTYKSFKSVSGVSLYQVYPDYKEMSDEQKNYVASFWDSLLMSCKDQFLLDSALGYRNFIDVDSYLDFTIFNELSRNSDGFRFSTYMYKPAHDKLHFGPLWDFDLTYGNSIAQSGNKSSGWLHSQSSNSVSFQKYFFKDTVLVHQFQARYRALRQDLLSDANIVHVADSLSLFLNVAAKRNYTAWPYDGYAMQSWVGTPAESTSADADTYYIKQWTLARLKWMDANIDKLYYPLAAIPVTIASQYESVSCTAWLIDGGRRASVFAPESEISDVQLYDLSGQILFSARINGTSAEIDMEAAGDGLCFLRVQLKDGSSCNFELLK